MRKYSIVFNSKTGNTALLAGKIKDILMEGTCIYCGPPEEQAKEADLIFVGFWTDKGSCNEETADFLQGLDAKKVFLFGTAGFGGSEEYFSRILSRVREHLKESNLLAGSFMCQGKMPQSVRNRYESMLEQNPVQMRSMIENFDLALAHPDDKDLMHLEEAVQKLLAIEI